MENITNNTPLSDIDFLDIKISKNYTLLQKHIDYLNQVNPENHSIALRQSIDRLILLDKKQDTSQRLNQIKDNIVIISIGMIFLLFGYISSNILINISALGLGLFFAAYGLITIFTDKKVKTK